MLDCQAPPLGLLADTSKAETVGRPGVMKGGPPPRLVLLALDSRGEPCGPVRRADNPMCMRMASCIYAYVRMAYDGPWLAADVARITCHVIS